MGNEFAIPGKRSATVDPMQKTTQAPGRSTRVQTEALGGNAGIDTGGACAASPNDPGCFLNGAQRGVLISELFGRIGNAQQNYTNACNRVSMERYVKPEDDLGLIGGMLVDIIFGNAKNAVVMAVRALRAPEAVYQTMVRARIPATPRAPAIPAAGQAQLEALIAMGVAPATAAMKASLQPAVTEKTKAMNYLDVLRDSSATAFQHLREDPVGSMSDFELLEYFASFDAGSHMQGVYEVLIRAKLERYLASNASKIGREANPDDWSFNGPKDDPRKDRERRVGWLRKEDGSTELIYVGEEFRGLQSSFAQQGRRENGLPKPGSNGGEYTQAPHLSLHEGKEPVKSGGEFMIGPVEPEFEDVALAKHNATWLESPQVYILDGKKLVKE